jgi:FAD/FMN-containing dehydrogenase
VEAGDPAVLAYGMGRSYGDSCLNGGGILLDTTGLDRFIQFDPFKGVLECEAGVTLERILELIVPHGWFLPVVPGTRYVTVGGAIANDIHGKNHHRAGTFGKHVSSLELLRSDGSRRICSQEKNVRLFKATIGGLGLTGLITRAELRLRKIANPFISMERVKFSNLEEFRQVSEESDREFEYTVAWVDCSASGSSIGRGLFTRGNHSEPIFGPLKWKRSKPRLSVPFNMPGFVMSRLSIQAFNTLYFHRQLSRVKRAKVPYEPFFFPLDSVKNWNRIYGQGGFFQYQCVLPAHDIDPIRELISRVSKSGIGSFLAVLKEFGAGESPGMLSFPRPGMTLAVDLRNRGDDTLKLLEELDEITFEAGGALYPAKDARMSGECFRKSFRKHREFLKHVDPAFSSSFWRRVMEER